MDHRVRFGPPDSYTSGVNNAENGDLLRLRDQHLVKGTTVRLFPSGREAHEEPALDLCAEAERRRTGVDSGIHENACLSLYCGSATDRHALRCPKPPLHSQGHKSHTGSWPATAWRRRSFPLRYWIPLTGSFQRFYTPSLCQGVRLYGPPPAFPPPLTPSFCPSSEAFSLHLPHV